MKKTGALLAGVMTLASIGPVIAASRDYISIVGSSTVYPFSTVVAEQFGKTSDSRRQRLNPQVPVAA